MTFCFLSGRALSTPSPPHRRPLTVPPVSCGGTDAAPPRTSSPPPPEQPRPWARSSPSSTGTIKFHLSLRRVKQCERGLIYQKREFLKVWWCRGGGDGLPRRDRSLGCEMMKLNYNQLSLIGFDVCTLWLTRLFLQQTDRYGFPCPHPQRLCG